METLTIDKSEQLLKTTTTQTNLLQHALAVRLAMGGMAKYFAEDQEYWEAVGLLHDYDYELYPDEHLDHTEKPLLDAGVDAVTIRAILSHGFGKRNNIMPMTNMEKSLYTVDAATGLISATAKMRPNGIFDLTASSVNKKFKDKAFAASVSRETIADGADMLGIDKNQIFTICIDSMKPYATELGIAGKQ